MSEQAEIRPVRTRRVSPGVEQARKVPIIVGSGEAFMLDQDPPRISMEDFRALLMSCVLSGASDVTIQSDQQPRAEIHGLLYRTTRRPWGPSEVDQVLMEVYGGANARTEINGQRVLDFSYELNLPDGSRQRFRCNAIGIFGRDGQGVEITLRALPSVTPSLPGVGLSEGETLALSPRDGIVIIAGATGSGKSTTMAAITRSHLENLSRPVKIVDIQAPIEYTYRDVTNGLTGSPSVIGQSEVGKHIRGFADGVHAALRRKPHIINVGEARDFETIQASIEASLTGHLVYTTTHAGSVADAVRRLLSVFPANERESRAYDLISALRFLMVQHLVPRIDRPGRVAIREYIRFTPRVREGLLDAPINDWPLRITDEVYGRTQGAGAEDMRLSLLDSVAPLFRDGVISRDDALRLGGLAVIRGGGKA
ncbi:defect-in-organelle-trafficking protein DotB [Gemmobacter caeni]|uniref:Defect-in-organelle-trafficking protein DotB n=1 Tax=Gemmobacter caeni TaxID=589035 RepID=A0A2T6B8W4_9RHOB|nr:ATPase, T2SS/T4P/T4SS family [Gemmobacter caeni]PTX52520.1 defect-in-organelle-trafficking protein DotB [Gemmobacter caeni]TWJ02809.1 defect-in-organelle-trafficking protein DotB [Gemmobacter caeni]